MLCPIPLFPGCKKPVSVAIRTVNGKSGEHVVLDAGDVPLDASDKSHTVADEFRDIRGVIGSAGSLRRVEDYLYEADFTHLDTAGAETHFRERFAGGATPGPFGFGCSVVRLGDLVGRAYDWKYDEAVTFVVRTPSDGTRFASVAVCSSPAGVTRQAVESLSVPGSAWSVLPFYATDGLNEHGVTCSVCVVRAKGDESVLWHGREFCAVGAVRQVLDRARTAQEGADIIASEAWMPAPDKLGGYSLHFMITDASHTFIVEDGIVTDITDDNVKAMTNFRLGSRSFLDDAGFADVDVIASYDPFGTGVERYNELVDYVKSASGNVGMREWLTGFKYSDAYGESLLTRSTTRPSDFAGTEISRDHFAKVNETEAIRAWFVSAKVHEKWIGRTRDGKFWQTVHSAVYDTVTRTVSVVVQEGTVVHAFSLARSGGGEGTVRSVNGVTPDEETGNVSLSASDVGTYTGDQIDDKINQSAAHYLTRRTGTEGHYSYPQFATHAALAAAKAAHTEENPQFFYGAEGHTPDKNDYCVVLADETHNGSTTRYAFVGEWDNNGYFRYQYTINETAFSQEQWDAINSLTSIDEDGNLCFDGIPFVNSSGELLFTEDDPIFTAWKNEVQIILGSGANVATGKYKQIAIGAHATANGQNAIALGSSEPAKTNGPRAMSQNAIAIGAGANATATNAVQIFAGTNNTPGTIQLGNKRLAFDEEVEVKRDKSDMFTEWEIVWEGHDTPRTWHIVWNNDKMTWLLLDGSEQLAISFQSDESTSLDFGIIGDDRIVATRQRILTTATGGTEIRDPSSDMHDAVSEVVEEYYPQTETSLYLGEPFAIVGEQLNNNDRYEYYSGRAGYYASRFPEWTFASADFNASVIRGTAQFKGRFNVIGGDMRYCVALFGDSGTQIARRETFPNDGTVHLSLKTVGTTILSGAQAKTAFRILLDGKEVYTSPVFDLGVRTVVVPFNVTAGQHTITINPVKPDNFDCVLALGKIEIVMAVPKVEVAADSARFGGKTPSEFTASVITDDLANPPSGKAAEAAAVKNELKGKLDKVNPTVQGVKYSDSANRAATLTVSGGDAEALGRFSEGGKVDVKGGVLGGKITVRKTEYPLADEADSATIIVEDVAGGNAVEIRGGSSIGSISNKSASVKLTGRGGGKEILLQSKAQGTYPTGEKGASITIGGVEVALVTDISDATKLASVYGDEWTFSGEDAKRFEHLSCKEVRSSDPAYSYYNLYDGDKEIGSTSLSLSNLESVNGFGYTDEEGAPREWDITATRSIDHYVTANGEKILAGTIAGVFATPAFAEAAFGEAATSETAIPNGGVADITKANGTINVTFANPKGDELRYCELIVRGVSADNAVSVNLPTGIDALYAEGVASKSGINKYIFAEHSRGHWQVSRVTLTTTMS